MRPRVAGRRRAARTAVHRPVPVVRAREHDVAVGQPPRGLEEVLDALLRGDPADVEHDGRAGRDDARERVDARRRRRRGNALPRTRTRAGSTPQATTSSRSRFGETTTSRAPRATPRATRRVERALQRAPSGAAGRNIPTGSKTYGTAARAAPAATPVVTGSRKPITCATSGRRGAAEVRGSVGVMPIQR